ncbi:hypothetical protein OE88DRAFT_1739602 [Heliocybe sulcata]|uniref:Uncharacterized protein n=1 Tax=Heliocybe sulcata TaxID=5364 RepID=A0A5C3MXX5_9AGAM|nr:hypothetical protein OE88DRAFT_1739602 [Heliocybe sulcata]
MLLDSDDESGLETMTRAEVEKSLSQKSAELVQTQAALKAAHLEVDQLKARIHEFEAEQAWRATSLTETNKVRKSGSEAVKRYGDEVSRLGRTYFLLKQAWLILAVFEHPVPEHASLDLRSSTRFNKNNTIKMEYLVTEFYEFLPQHLHDPIRGDPELQETFRKAHANLCANEINTIRKAAHIIFALGGSALLTGSQPHFRTRAPILFADGVMINANIFRNLALLRMAKCLLRGPASLTSEKHSTKSKARTYSIKHVHENTIALVAVIAVFLLSNDSSFPGDGTGERSSINYQRLFNKYLKALLDARETTPETINLYDEFIFGTSADAAQLSDDSSDAEETHMMAGLQHLQIQDGINHDDIILPSDHVVTGASLSPETQAVVSLTGASNGNIHGSTAGTSSGNRSGPTRPARGGRGKGRSAGAAAEEVVGSNPSQYE